ncbi:MAG: DMT family transporter [Actinobacteria bacterium]|nr:DMT family transporter [Actinomycetota bacterium]
MSDLLRTWAGVVLISFSAVYVRLADVEATRSAFLRVAYALPVFALLVVWRRRRSETPTTDGYWVPVAAVAGAFLALDLVSWHTSIGLIGAGLATVLANLQVVVVGIIGVVLFRERPRGTFWLALPIVLVGVWLLGATGEPVESGGSVLAGVGFGVLTALAYSVFLVVLRQARLGGADVLPSMASATLGATVVAFAFAAAQGVAAPPASLEANVWLVALALGSQVAGWLLLTSSIDRLPAALTSVALLLQPVLAMLWGALLLSEPIGPPQVAGAAIVLAGVAVAHRAARVAVHHEAEEPVGVP